MNDEEFMFDIEDLNITEEKPDIITDEDEEKKEELKPQDEVNIEETVEEEEEKATDEDTPSSSKEDSSQHSTLYALAKYLKEEGVLYLEEDIEDVNSLEELKTLIQESNSKARYVNLNDSQKRYQEALENGIPKNEFEQLETEIQTFEKISDEDIEGNETLRFEITALDLINKGIEKDKAIKLAKLSLTDESNVEDTKKTLQSIIDAKKTAFKEKIESSKSETQLAIDDIKTSVYGKSKILDMKVNENTKSKLFNLMTTKVGTDDNGKPLNKVQVWQKENPLEASIFMNYLYLMTNEGKDLGLIRKSSTSVASKELEKKLRSMSFDKSGALIIPDEYTKERAGSRNRKISSTDNELTINI